MLLNEFMLSSKEIAKCVDINKWRFETAKLLLACTDLGMISVWSPTFLLLLLEYIESRDCTIFFSALIDSHQKSLCYLAQTQTHFLLDRSSSSFIPKLRRWFPHVTIQSKGLLAVENCINPALNRWFRPGGGGHFLEFIELAKPNSSPCRPLNLKLVDIRSLLTTSGGLYRYNLKDSVQCLGYYHSTPIIRFEVK